MSPIDKLFLEIFGYKPKKDGTAYEMLACIAEKILFEGRIVHDRKIRGQFSKTLYQIDVLSENQSDVSMGEAKDYTIQGKPVGRGDLQKLGGALPDIDKVSKGRFYSATGYTEPAKKYAKASGSFSGGKGIELYEFRPSTELDEMGTIKTIRINMKLIAPHPREASWTPHVTDEAKENCRAFLREGERELNFKMELEILYDKEGAEKLKLLALTGRGYGEVNIDTRCAHGCFLLENHYIYLNQLLVELRGLEYKVPYTEIEQILEINFDSKARFVVKNQSGEVLRFISDAELRTYEFDSDGNLKKL
jgi:Restriction endonuclease